MIDNMKAYIYTEAGNNIGLGHINRCIALGQALNQLNINCFFNIYGSESIKDLNLPIEYELFNWIEDDWESCNYNEDIVIIDSYLAPREILGKIEKNYRIAAYFDDNNRLEYPPGVVINSSIAAHHLKYPQRSETEYLLGPKYHPLRREFWDCADKTISPDVDNILITMGGSDIHNLTLPIIKTLSQKYKFNKHVVVSHSFQDTKRLYSYEDDLTCYISNPPAGAIKGLMMSADIAVSASGQTIYELARVGVPTIAVAVADNQELNIKGWSGTGFIEFAGWWNDKKLMENICIKIDYLMNYHIRKIKTATGRKHITGSGAMNIAEFIVKKSNSG